MVAVSRVESELRRRAQRSLRLLFGIVGKPVDRAMVTVARARAELALLCDLANMLRVSNAKYLELAEAETWGFEAAEACRRHWKEHFSAC